MNWKNLHAVPPQDPCNICIKIGFHYGGVFYFQPKDLNEWCLFKDFIEYPMDKFPKDTFYINLDEIL